MTVAFWLKPLLQFPPPTSLRKLLLADSILLVDPLGFNLLGSVQAQWTSSARMLEFQWLVPFPSTDARGNTGGISCKRASVPCMRVGSKTMAAPNVALSLFWAFMALVIFLLFSDAFSFSFEIIS